MSEKSVGDLLFEKGPLGDLARKAAEELGDSLSASYSVRIPAAIKHAKEHVSQHGPDDFFCCRITAGEVALAEALWDYTQLLMHGPEKQAMLERDPTVFNAPALLAFCEKVEKLP